MFKSSLTYGDSSILLNICPYEKKTEKKKPKIVITCIFITFIIYILVLIAQQYIKLCI